MEGEFPGKMWLQMDEKEGFKKLASCFKTTHVTQISLFHTRLDVSGSTTQNNQGKKMYCDGCNY